MLRPDVIYVALCQNDVGLTKKFCDRRPNVLGECPPPIHKPRRARWNSWIPGE